jgi:hypothetical protein
LAVAAPSNQGRREERQRKARNAQHCKSHFQLIPSRRFAPPAQIPAYSLDRYCAFDKAEIHHNSGKSDCIPSAALRDYITRGF